MNEPLICWADWRAVLANLGVMLVIAVAILTPCFAIAFIPDVQDIVAPQAMPLKTDERLYWVTRVPDKGRPTFWDGDSWEPIVDIQEQTFVGRKSAMRGINNADDLSEVRVYAK